MTEHKKDSMENLFDFKSHRDQSILSYTKVHQIYADFCKTVKTMLEVSLKESNVYYHSIEARAKSIESFGNKSEKPSEYNPTEPKYREPLKEITDLAGIRIITFFPSTTSQVEDVLKKEFIITERSDKSELNDDKLGYKSIHLLIKLKKDRTTLSEYKRFDGITAEVQVRTILQHAWAEIEHDIQYKSEVAIPKTIRRRFMALAGLLEIADREFQSIQDEEKNIRETSRIHINDGKYTDIEITPDSLRVYLDKQFGSDNRIARHTYAMKSRLLNRMGFEYISQLEECIGSFNKEQINKISKLIYGQGQGQIYRFDAVLVAGLGDKIKELHPYCKADPNYWVESFEKKIEKIRAANIPIKNYDPRNI
ncbi:TPA: GTP pyrophosphokinase [Aeromonas veronii]|uniref:GTP pyrophosphokinase n=1 Tax=Aeromonas veronii TaxID=654 RepID=UPI000B599E7F|nr:hypothetical protein [Aeromonas veronii]